jgi:dihydroflavonol-4-reductase
VMVNPTAVLGPHDYAPSAMGAILLALYHRRLPALVDGGFNWVDVRDVCQGAIAAGEKGKRGERYLLGGVYLSVAQLARHCAEITGKSAPRWVAPVWMAQLGTPFAVLYARLTGRPAIFTSASLRALTSHQQVSHAKAARDLGYQPRPIRETLADTYAWFEAHGDLAKRR